MQDANQPAMAIKEGSIKGNHLGWKFDLKKPMPLTVTFTLQLDGDAMTGTGKAGVFPPAPVSALRVHTAS
jgi:hypothetical protein